jgi:hypothetical protein
METLICIVVMVVVINVVAFVILTRKNKPTVNAAVNVAENPGGNTSGTGTKKPKQDKKEPDGQLQPVEEKRR